MVHGWRGGLHNLLKLSGINTRETANILKAETRVFIESSHSMTSVKDQQAELFLATLK
jgi:hypothetical protein